MPVGNATLLTLEEPAVGIGLGQSADQPISPSAAIGVSAVVRDQHR